MEDGVPSNPKSILPEQAAKSNASLNGTSNWKVRPDWKAAQNEVLHRLNIREEYEALGLRFRDGPPSAKGWLECRPNKSAAVNVRSGWFKDLGGDGLSCSLWDYAAQHGRYPSWLDALRHFADKVGVALPGPRRRRSVPTDSQSPPPKRRSYADLEALAQQFPATEPAPALTPSQSKRRTYEDLLAYSEQIPPTEPLRIVTTDNDDDTLAEFRLTDVGNAQRLVAQHGKDLRHCHPWRKWLVWDGMRWRIDDTGEIMLRAKQTVAELFRDVAEFASIKATDLEEARHE